MEISAIRLYKISVPEEAWYWVSVQVKSGLTGWGEMAPLHHDQALASLFTQVTPPLMNQDPRRLLDLLGSEDRRPSIQQYGLVGATVWAGLDQALWDLYAKSIGVPLYVLLGAYGRRQIALYANLNRGLRTHRSPQALAQHAKDAREAGFQTIKCAPFDEVHPSRWDSSIDQGIDRLHSAMTIVPLDTVAIDCHERFTAPLLARMVENLPTPPYWIEDPVSPRHYHDWKSLRSRFPRLRWAGGENSLTVDDLVHYVEAGLVDVVMPDIKYLGMSAIRSLIPVLEELGVGVSLHNPSGPIATAHSAHVSALCQRSIPMEYPIGVTPLRAVATHPAEDVQHGSYTLSDHPGIGLEPDPHFLGQYGAEWRRGEWATLPSS